MIKVLLDTNIYGRISEDIEDGPELVERIKQDPHIVIPNFRLIRKELRRAPKLLPLYDRLVSKKVIDETPQIRALADAYFQEYKTQGGHQSKKKILNDFKIVACASLIGADIIYTEDKRTMQHAAARNAYEIVNAPKGLRSPYFLPLKRLKGRYF